MIVIIDYGVGNLGSVHNMLRKCGVKSKISNSKDDIINAEKFILPGVGHFSVGMNKLMESGILTILEDQVLNKGKPILGICLGMQMLAKNSQEGNVQGLGWIDAEVKRFPDLDDLVIPHMGWNNIQVLNNKYYSNLENSDFYFIHSYHVKTTNDQDIAATVNYGFDVVASVQKDNIFATQFHPEKSQAAGLSLLKTFFDLNA